VKDSNQQNEEKNENKNLINLNSGDLLDSKTIFSSTLDRTIDSGKNEEFTQLILENKLDFSKEKLNVKSMNIADKELNEDFKEE
jgi:hypothetical protein